MPFGVSNEELGLTAKATQLERARALAQAYDELGHIPDSKKDVTENATLEKPAER